MALCIDPAVTYLRGFGFNVVRLPRASIQALDLLGQADGPLIRLGPLSDVWKTEKPEPKARPDETVDIKAQSGAKLKLVDRRPGSRQHPAGTDRNGGWRRPRRRLRERRRNRAELRQARRRRIEPQRNRRITGPRIAEFMFEKGLAQAERPHDIRAWIEGQIYQPQY
jgi:hypothetical protein